MKKFTLVRQVAGWEVKDVMVWAPPPEGTREATEDMVGRIVGDGMRRELVKKRLAERRYEMEGLR